MLAEENFLLSNHINKNPSVSELQRCFNGVGQAGSNPFFDNNPVDDHFNIMLFIFFKRDILAQIIHFSVHADADETGFFNILHHLDMGALFPGNDGSKNLQPRSFGKFHNPVDHLLNGLGRNFNSVFRTNRTADPCIQKTEIVIDFCYCPYRRTGVIMGCFLVDGNGRWQSFNRIDIRFTHLSEKLKGIGR